MNYFEKRELVRDLLGKELSSEFPEVCSLFEELAARLINQREGLRKPLGENPAFVNYGGTHSYRDIHYWVKSALYASLPSVSASLDAKVLVSTFLYRRFPHLIEEIAKVETVAFAVTRPTAAQAYRAKLRPVVKFDDVFYSPRSNAVISALVRELSVAAEQRRAFDAGRWRAELGWLEGWLVNQTLVTAGRLEQNGIGQYISAFSNRFEDYFLSRGCRHLGIPSKEVCHGLNAHRLEDSDNTVPVHADLFFGWTKDYCENIRGYEWPERIHCVGYPKYSASKVTRLRNRYPVKRVITFFSQATYDIGSPVDLPMTASLMAEEARFRSDLFLALRELKTAHGFEVRIRYHPGELRHDTSLRATERAELLGKWGFVESKSSFDQDLFESEVAIGVNSSCLYESFLVGNKSLQLKFGPTKSAYYRDIPLVEVADLSRAIGEMRLTGPRFDRLMDVGRLLEMR